MGITDSFRAVQQMYNKTGVSAPESGQSFFFDLIDDDLGVVHFNKTAGTGTFVLQGRMDPSLPFVDLQQTPPTDDDLEVNVPFMPEMRVNVTAATGLSLECWVME